MKTRFLTAIALSLALSLTARAQYTGNFQTNTISAVTSNWVGNGTYVVGSNTSFDALIIQNSGVLSNGTGYIGYEANASYNIAVARDAGSVWSNRFDLYVGYRGAGNQLIITNGATVVSSNGYVGFANFLANTNNTVVVTGAGSVWTNIFGLTVGAVSGGNRLIIANGGKVIDQGTAVGDSPGAATNGAAIDNSVLVTDTNSVWINNGTVILNRNSPGTVLTVANGAQFTAVNVAIATSAASDGDVVLVTDPGTIWTNTAQLGVGGFGSYNQFVVSNGASAFSTTAAIGGNVGMVSNTAVVTGPRSVWTVGFTITVGDSGTASSLTAANNGLIVAQSELLAGSGGGGALIIAGGTNLVYDKIQVGLNGGTGTVSVLGGALFVTNATATASVTVNTNSTLLLGAGTFKTDNLIVTNGGAVQYVQALQVDNASVALAAGSTLTATNAPTTIGGGSNSTASLTSSSSTLNLAQLDAATGSNSTATVTFLANTTTLIQSNLTAGAGPGSVATILVNGGNHTVNSVIGVGNNGALTGGSGTAQFTINNASVTTKGVNLGSTLGGHGVMTIQPGAILHIIGGCAACGFTSNEGILSGGIIDSPNAPFWAGMTHPGEFIISNGVATFQSGFVGFDNLGSLTQAGGTLNVLSNLVVGDSLGATGIVTMTGGSIFATNGTFAIGNGASLLSTGGYGHASISAGTVDAASVLIGDNFGSDANLTVSGTAVVRAHGGLRSNGIKTTVINGGTLEVVLDQSPAFEDPILHDRIVVSYLADGKMIVSNGTVRTPGMIVAASASNTGTLNIVGGITSVYSNFTVGWVPGATGIVTVTGGALYCTNGVNSTLEVRNGTFTVSGGYVQVDKLVVTNANARLIHTGGTLLYTTLVLDPNQSAVGDGIPNGWKQTYGFDPFNPVVASADTDGDGMNNQQEYQAGTDPTNSASAFHITTIAPTGNNVVVTWLTGLGKTNALQSASGASYNTNFTDVVIVTNTTTTITNATDIGGATNQPARFYRVRLVP